MSGESPLKALLAALGLQEPAPAGEALTCEDCGLPYTEFQENGLLGCPACYRCFGEALDRLLQEIHGCTRHGGKQPPENREDKTCS